MRDGIIDAIRSRPVGTRLVFLSDFEIRKTLPLFRETDPSERALALARILAAPPFSGRTYEHTTNLCTVDREGNACVLTTSLGLGSGDFLPGYDVHLNSMLGESDLLIGPLEPGKRMESMMSPTTAFDWPALTTSG